MMNKTLVIIPHFNKLALLKECLFHLDNQNYKSFDIMIVDNGSSDGSSEYIFELSKNNTNYHSILLNDNMGFAYAVNKGLEYSIANGYDYSILLNNDAYVEDNFVKSLIYKMNTGKDIFAVSSLMINYHNKNIVDSFGDYYTVLGYAFQGHIDEDILSVNDEEAFSACGGASIYSNAILDEIGLFDNNFFAYLEDIDISYRAKLYGYKILTCKDAKCYHLGSATTGTKYNKFKVRTSARNNIYLLYKNMPYVQILINIFPLFVGHLVKFLFFKKKGFALDYFFGVADGFKNVHKIKKVDFKDINIANFIFIEYELIINTFKYIINFVKRHID